jgi:hypothetical protein
VTLDEPRSATIKICAIPESPRSASDPNPTPRDRITRAQGITGRELELTAAGRIVALAWWIARTVVVLSTFDDQACGSWGRELPDRARDVSASARIAGCAAAGVTAGGVVAAFAIWWLVPLAIWDVAAVAFLAWI